MEQALLTPYLGLDDCAAAIAFYRQAFGAEEIGLRFTDSDGRIGHAEISIGGAVLFVADEYPEVGASSPKSLGGSHAALHLKVADAQATGQRLVAAGAEVLNAVAEQADGERRGVFKDPFGYRWMIAETGEERTQAEVQQRIGERYKVN